VLFESLDFLERYRGGDADYSDLVMHHPISPHYMETAISTKDQVEAICSYHLFLERIFEAETVVERMGLGHNLVAGREVFVIVDDTL